MRFLLLLLLPIAAPAAAVDRVELTIGHVEAPDWQLRDTAVDWERGNRVRLQTRALAPDLPAPLHLELDCAQLQAGDGARCADLQLRARIDGATVQVDAALQLSASDRWRLVLPHGEARLQYDSVDGRLAAENLRVGFAGALRRDGAATQLQLQGTTTGGQGYVEPWFVDFDAQPLGLDLVLTLDRNRGLHVEQMQLQQRGLGMLRVGGTAMLPAWRQQHRLQIEARIDDAAAASPHLQAALAQGRLRGLQLDGSLRLAATVGDGRLQHAEAGFDELSLAAPGLAIELDGLHGELAWDATLPARRSQLGWRAGRIGRIPVGAARLAFEATDRRFALSLPTRIPLLDGSLAIERLALADIGSAALQADFAARLDPIDLAGLCRALGWPAFSGTLSGEIPGLQLRDQRLLLDGALTASAFDGEIRISELSVVEPLGVLPRLHADVRLRRLDLAALTGAFDFGRITGRLDGDVDGLRLIGWEPVAMDAHLYSTPGDRSRKRISQRAIDNISAVGGGPTGLLSRGVLRFFDEFAYRRIGWRCMLDNGICRMDGIRASDEGDGYVLVQGRGLPRIDVVVYSRRVSWPVFMSQLRSIGKTGPAKLGTP